MDMQDHLNFLGKLSELVRFDEDADDEDIHDLRCSLLDLIKEELLRLDAEEQPEIDEQFKEITEIEFPDNPPPG